MEATIVNQMYVPAPRTAARRQVLVEAAIDEPRYYDENLKKLCHRISKVSALLTIAGFAAKYQNDSFNKVVTGVMKFCHIFPNLAAKVEARPDLNLVPSFEGILMIGAGIFLLGTVAVTARIAIQADKRARAKLSIEERRQVQALPEFRRVYVTSPITVSAPGQSTQPKPAAAVLFRQIVDAPNLQTHLPNI